MCLCPARPGEIIVIITHTVKVLRVNIGDRPCCTTTWTRLVLHCANTVKPNILRPCIYLLVGLRIQNVLGVCYWCRILVGVHVWLVVYSNRVSLIVWLQKPCTPAQTRTICSLKLGMYSYSSVKRNLDRIKYQYNCFFTDSHISLESRVTMLSNYRTLSTHISPEYQRIGNHELIAKHGQLFTMIITTNTFFSRSIFYLYLSRIESA